MVKAMEIAVKCLKTESNSGRPVKKCFCTRIPAVKDGYSSTYYRGNVEARNTVSRRNLISLHIKSERKLAREILFKRS